MKLMTKELRKKLPPLYSQDEKGLDALALVHYFNASGQGDWWISEFDGEDLMFGLCYITDKELGYVNLSELQEFKGRFGLGIERDIYWNPKTLEELMK